MKWLEWKRVNQTYDVAQVWPMMRRCPLKQIHQLQNNIFTTKGWCIFSGFMFQTN